MKMWHKLFLMIFYQIAICNSEEIVNLVCPSGWQAYGQAWYGNCNHTDHPNATTNAQPIETNQATYNDLLSKNGATFYKPSKFKVCLICDKKLTDQVPQRLIEICATQFQFKPNETLHYENQICTPQNDFHEYTILWCEFKPACGMQVAMNRATLFHTLVTNYHLPCDENIIANVKPANTKSEKLQLDCPHKSILFGIEERHIMCSNGIRQSFCILCDLNGIRFSVCAPQECSDITNNQRIRNLVIKNSKCKMKTTGREGPFDPPTRICDVLPHHGIRDDLNYCGFKIQYTDGKLNADEPFPIENFISCNLDQNNKDYKLYGLIVFGIVTIPMVITIICLAVRVKRLTSQILGLATGDVFIYSRNPNYNQTIETYDTREPYEIVDTPFYINENDPQIQAQHTLEYHHEEYLQ